MSPEFWTRSGAILMLAAVSLGAFAAHGLKSRLPPDLLAAFETGVRYHVYHALALFVVAWTRSPGAGWCFLAGIVLFSGSLYALALTGIRAFGAVTPLGGLAFLGGWLLLALKR